MTQEVYAGSGTASFTPERLLSGDTPPVVTAEVTLKSGQNIARYSVLGVDSSGKALLSLSAAVDGSQTPKYIAAYAEDASGGEKVVQVYAQGCFSPDLLVFGTGHTAASTAEALRDRGIFLKSLA